MKNYKKNYEKDKDETKILDKTYRLFKNLPQKITNQCQKFKW